MGAHDDSRLEPEQESTVIRHDSEGLRSDGETVISGVENAEAREDEAPALQFGEYELLGEIARGGMGVVYKARQRRLNRTVALKMILSGSLASESDVRRFYTEAEAAAALDHSGIVSIHEIGEHQGQHFYSMAYIDGQSLHAKLKQGPLPIQQAAELIRQVAEAVHFAHVKGIIHRDIKPHNILLDQAGHPKVTDFGLAKMLDHQEGLTSTGDILGTPNYMAPEQAAGDLAAIGPQTDVYALGAVLYACLAGRPPFQAATLTETLRQVVEQDPVSPSLLNPAIPVDLATICLKCLRKEPAKRYGSAQELADDLRRFLRGESILARPTSTMEKAVKWCRRKPVLAALWGVSAAAVLLTIGLSYYFTYRIADQQGKMAIAESERHRSDEQRIAAQALATTQQYYAKLMEARERITQKELNWSAESLPLLEEAAALSTPARDPADLRTAMAACLTGTNLRLAGQIAEGFSSSALAFHPNGELLALSERRPTGFNQFSLRVRVLKFPSGELVQELTWPTNVSEFFRSKRPDRSVGLVWSRDGRWLAAASRHGAAHVWDFSVEGTPKLHSLNLGGILPGVLSFSEDGRFLYSGLLNQQQPSILKCWRLGEAIEEIASLETGPLKALAAYGNDAVFAGHTGNLVSLEPETLQPKVSREWPMPVIVADSRREVLIVGNSNEIAWLKPTDLWGASAFRSSRADLSTYGLSLMRQSADGRMLLTISEETGSVELWDCVTGEHFARWTVTESPGAAEFHPSGRWLAVCRKNYVEIVELTRYQEHATTGIFLTTPLAVGVDSRSESLLALHLQGVRGESGILTAWSSEFENANVPLRRHQFGAMGGHYVQAGVSVHPFNGRFAVGAALYSTVFCGDLNEGLPLWTQEINAPRDVAFTPDGRHVWVAHAEDVTILFGEDGTNTGYHWKNTWAAVNNGGMMNCAAVSRDWAAFGDHEGVLHLFPRELPANPADFRPAWSLPLNRLVPVEDVAISPDQTWILAGDRSGTVHKVHSTDRQHETFPLHRQSVTSVAFLADGLFLTGSVDRTIRCSTWASTGIEELFQLPASGPVRQFHLSPDGKLLAVLIDGERGAHVWNLEALLQRFAEQGLEIPGEGAASQL